MDEDTYKKILDIFNEARTIDATKSSHNGYSLKLRASGSENYPHPIGVEFVRGHGKRLVEETGHFISGMRQHNGEDPYIEVWFDEVTVTPTKHEPPTNNTTNLFDS